MSLTFSLSEVVEIIAELLSRRGPTDEKPLIILPPNVTLDDEKDTPSGESPN